METTKNTSSAKKLCIFHKHCLDGFASAYVVGEFFGIGNVEFMALDYHNPIPDIAGRDVYIVDFSWPPEQLLAAAVNANSVVMLDHHDKALKEWESFNSNEIPKNFVSVFDTSKAGVGVVWDFFYNNSGATKQVPLPSLLMFIQDYDLYKFEYSETRQIHAALTSTSMLADQRFHLFQDIVRNVEKDGYAELVRHGRVVLDAQRVLCNNIVERNRGEVVVLGYTVPICNVPHELRDMAGELLFKNVPFSITYEDRISEGVRKFSLRSARETGINVIEIAKQLGGGGGHPHASGFTLPLTKKMTGHEVTFAELINF